MIKMSLDKARRAIELTARREGITAEQVRQEIQEAIDRAFDNPPNDLAAYKIRQIPCKGERPTPEEFIVYVAEQASK